MNCFEEAVAAMKLLFQRDYQFALATICDNKPTVRFVDTYFDGSAFFVVTYAKSQKVMDISKNPHVALTCRQLHSFNGIATNVGHPLNPENKIIRKQLISVFEDWYFKHNNEDDDNMCYLRIVPISGFFHYNGIGYNINFAEQTATSEPFVPTIVYTED